MTTDPRTGFTVHNSLTPEQYEAERAAREVLALPMFAEIRADEQHAVVAAIAEFLG